MTKMHPARAALRALFQSPGARHLTVGTMARRVGVSRKTVRRWIDRDYPDLAQQYWPRPCDLEAAAAMNFIEARVRPAHRCLLNFLPPPESGGEAAELLQ